MLREILLLRWNLFCHKNEHNSVTVMKKLLILSTRLRPHLTGMPGLATMFAGLAAGFLFVTTSTSVAQGPPGGCQVCHKGRHTLTLPCQSSAVERHIAHGDTAGPCPATPTRQAAAATAERSAVKKPASKATTARVQAAVE